MKCIHMCIPYFCAILRVFLVSFIRQIHGCLDVGVRECVSYDRYMYFTNGKLKLKTCIIANNTQTYSIHIYNIFMYEIVWIECHE